LPDCVEEAVALSMGDVLEESRNVVITKPGETSPNSGDLELEFIPLVVCELHEFLDVCMHVVKGHEADVQPLGRESIGLACEALSYAQLGTFVFSCITSCTSTMDAAEV